jgi:acetyl esterase/lipase
MKNDSMGLRIFLLLAALCGARSAGAQAWKDPANWPAIPAPQKTSDVVYFPKDTPGYTPTSQLLDVYQNEALPAGAKAPVLMYIHGGGWMNGKRPESYTSFRAWLAAGFSVVNVEYRLVETVPSATAPAAVQDIGCALAWIKQNASKYNFDADRVVTYGTSAGGHLALMAAVLPKDNDITLPACRDQAHIVAVLDFYGPYHLEPSDPSAYLGATRRWMGPDPQPSLEALEHKMSPSTYIRAGIPPVFQAHGDADPTVPYLSSVELKKDLDKAGVKNVFTTVPGGLHGKWTPEENVQVQMDSLKFLQSVGVIE